MQSLPPFKRVVTGHSEAGQALAAFVGTTPQVFSLKSVPGTIFHEVWNSCTAPAQLDNGADPTDKPLTLIPSPLGSVIRVVDIPPDSVQNAVSEKDAAAALAEIGAVHAATAKPDYKHKLMHRTEILDYGIVTVGEVQTMPGATVQRRWQGWSSSCSMANTHLNCWRFWNEIRNACRW